MYFKKITVFVFKWIAIFLIVGTAGTAYGQHHMHQTNTPLTEAGNDIFGTIQEVVQKLEADPNTNWSQVNLEALRQHLLDMKAFTEEVKVISKQPVESGVQVEVKPTSARAEQALKNLFRMHPSMIKKEKGWNMDTKPKGDHWVITCTTERESEVEKIRGLGYIGLIAEGAHHQMHHWMIATGKMKMK